MDDGRPISAVDLLRWAETLAGVARTGLGFTQSLYERERFEEVLKVAADINAVPPPGIAGLAVDADGAKLAGQAVGIGAITVGRLKFQVQHELLKRMATGDGAVTIAIEETLALARSLASRG